MDSPIRLSVVAQSLLALAIDRDRLGVRVDHLDDLLASGRFAFSSAHTCLNRATVSDAMAITNFSEILAFAARCYNDNISNSLHFMRRPS